MSMTTNPKVENPPAETLAEKLARLAEEARTFTWEGYEDEQHRERMNACRSRREQWGEDDCDEHDGSCAECKWDMIEALETEASKKRRAQASVELESLRQQEKNNVE